jgi:hypothetical protein
VKKVISFSVWGNSEHYVLGAILNADIAEKEWQDWICRFYVSPNVPEPAIKELERRSNVEVFRMQNDAGWNGMFWRFLPASDPEVDVMISRDSDSRINVRDKAAVDEWLDSGKKFHIMRDMCQHMWPICGGMWGVRDKFLSSLSDEIMNYDRKNHDNNHGIDQKFLTDLYPRVVNDALIHDDWFPHYLTHENKKEFPIKRLRGNEWWKKDFPEWHNGLELEKGDGHWFRNENCKNPECCMPCPACGSFHDNCYIGQSIYISQENRDKYSKLMEYLT